MRKQARKRDEVYERKRVMSVFAGREGSSR